MHFSISSVLISLLLASALILILHVLLTSTKTYRVFRIDFVFVFALIIGLRLFFPFEFINTHTFSSHNILPTLYSFANRKISGAPISLSKILLVIWFLGSLLFLGHFFFQLLALNKISSCSTNVDINQLASRLHVNIPRHIQVRYLPYISSPFVCHLFRPTIVLSNAPFSDKEFTYILLHELQHIRNRDILSKYVSQILVCLYWWFPPVWVYRRQIDMILEMRVDYQITKEIDNSSYLNYVESLINVAKNMPRKSDNHEPIDNTLLSHFTILERSTLKRRVNFLLEGFTIKRTSRAIRVCLVLIPLLITSIIIEPDYATQDKVSGTKAVNPSTSYIVKKKNKFHLYIDGTDMGSFKSLDDPSLKGIPVKKGNV